MAARCHQRVLHDYEALLVFSCCDEELAMYIWQTLKGNNYRITHHQDPDGPFRIGFSAYDNMVNAIERSRKVLVLFTKSAVDSGFVSLEMMLAIEKSRRTGQMGLCLIAVGLTDKEVCSLKHGLLGCVPHIHVDTNSESWQELLLKKVTEPAPSMRNLLPAGNLAHGQVFSHFVGYLEYVLPVFQLRLREWSENSDIYKSYPGKICNRYMLLIPQSCNTEIPIDQQYDDCGVSIEHVDNLTIHVTHGDKKREYSPSIYRATFGSTEPIYFIGEHAKVLFCAFQLKKRSIATVDPRLEANRFYFTMNNLLNHRENVDCNDRATLLIYPDEKLSAGKILWMALTKEVERQETNTPSQDVSCFNFLRVPSSEYDNDATITSFSFSEEDGKVACDIANFLEERGKRVILRNANAGNLQELDSARWNVFVMSQDSFHGEFLGLELIAAIERCANNRCIQVLPVISGMRMEEVPDALKWVTMISTEQHDYKQILLQQMDDLPVHMHQKMPAGDVSTGLAWAYILNYLPIQFTETTEDGLDFEARIKKHLQDKENSSGCLPYFYIILSSTGEVIKPDTPGGPITCLGRAEPPIRKQQAGTKAREYYIYMYQYTSPNSSQKVCYICEACTPGISLNTMANELPFAGIEPGEILRGQIQNLGCTIEKRLHDPGYIREMGDFTNRVRLIRYDLDSDRQLCDVIGEQLSEDLQCSNLIFADNSMDMLD